MLPHPYSSSHPFAVGLVEKLQVSRINSLLSRLQEPAHNLQRKLLETSEPSGHLPLAYSDISDRRTANVSRLLKFDM
jgi:hypothetical protein